MTSKKMLLQAVGLNIIFFILYLAFGRIRYGSLDDYFMSSVLTGAYGSSYDIHTYFVNAGYGIFLMPFYLLFPKIGWYFIFELIGTFSAFTVFTFCIIRKIGTKYGLPISLVMLAVFTPDFYFQLSFTQCATAYTAAGILLFLLGDREENKKMLVLGGFFLIAGSIMRWEGFLLGLPFACLLLASNVLDRKKIYKASIVVACLVVCAIMGLRLYDRSLYTQEDYKYYADYQPIRAFFGDGAFYDSESSFDELEERGLAGIDYQFAQSWTFYDTDVLGIDSLKGIMEVAKRNLYEPNWSRMPIAFFLAVSNALTRTNGWCWVVFCVILIFIPSKKTNLYPWASLFIVAACLGYLLLVNRLVYHVESGIWLYATSLAIPFFSKDAFCKNPFVSAHGKFLFVIAAIFTAVFAFLSISSQSLKTKWNLIETPELTKDWNDFLDYAARNPEDVFLLSFERYKQLGSLKDKAYNAIEPGSWNNLFSLGYWNIHLPAMKEELAKRGVKNPIKDIVNSNVYVVENGPYPSIPTFYQTHYHKCITVDTVSSFGEIKLLKYRLMEEK